MRYPAMSGTKTYRIRIPDFSGGLNRGVPAQMIGDNQLSDCENVWFKDGAIRTRDGFQTSQERIVENAAESSDIVVALHEAQNGMTAIRMETALILLDRDGKTVFSTPLERPCSSAFFAEFGSNDRISGAEGATKSGLLLYEDTGLIWRIDLSELVVYRVVAQDDAYAPLYFVNGKPSSLFGEPSSGTTYEGFNLLTNRFRAQYTTSEDGANFTIPVALANGEATAVYTGSDGTAYTFTLTVNKSENLCVSDGQSVQLESGEQTLYLMYARYWNSFCFATEKESGGYDPVALPFVGFSNNVEFTLMRDAVPSMSVFGMTRATWFGGDRAGVMGGTRLFVAGSEREPNLVRYSDVNDPLYFPENNFMYVGGSEQRVTALAKQSGVLVMFKEHEIYFCEYAYAAVDAQGIEDATAVDVTSDAFFPITQLSAGIGCDLPDTVALCGTRLVWATREGRVYTITSLSNLTERSVRPISYQIEKDLKQRELSNASACLYDGWYALLSGDNELYMLDTASYGFVYFTSYYNDEKASSKIVWFRWKAPLSFKWPDGSEHTGVAHRVFRMGDGAGVLARSDLWRVYGIEGEHDTAVNKEMGAETYAKVDISSEFTTKLYDLGSIERNKHVTGLFVSVANGEEAAVAVTYITDHGEEKDQLVLRGRAAWDVYDDGRFTEMSLTPHVMRAQYFGVRFHSARRMALGGIVILYKIIGEVR